MWVAAARHPTFRTGLALGLLQVHYQQKSFIPWYSNFPRGAGQSPWPGHQLASEHHFPSLATTKTVAVVDFLSLVSLSFSNQSAQLAIVCSTAVSAGSMWSKRLMNISQTESPSTVQVPQLLLPQETEISNSVRPSYLESLSFQATHQTHSSKCGLGWYQRWDQPGANVEHKQKAACPWWESFK